MTLYMVKHADGDVRLHDESGGELFDVPNDIRNTDGAERDLIEAYKSANPSADLLGDSVRPYFLDMVTGNWQYRDLTVAEETVPWQ